MRRKWIFLAAPVGMAVVVFIGGELVMHLWNWLMPSLFGWRQVSFWQAFGLLALCRILVGGFGMRGGGMHRSYYRRRMAERWEAMTPEERQKFSESMHGRWGRMTHQDPGSGI